MQDKDLQATLKWLQGPFNGDPREVAEFLSWLTQSLAPNLTGVPKPVAEWTLCVERERRIKEDLEAEKREWTKNFAGKPCDDFTLRGFRLSLFVVSPDNVELFFGPEPRSFALRKRGIGKKAHTINDPSLVTWVHGLLTDAEKRGLTFISADTSTTAPNAPLTKLRLEGRKQK